MEPSRVVFCHSENIIDRRYAVVGSIASKLVVSELGFDLLRSLSSKTKSVQDDRSILCKHFRTGKLNDADWSFVVTPRANNLAWLYLGNYSYLKFETRTVPFQSPRSFE